MRSVLAILCSLSTRRYTDGIYDQTLKGGGEYCASGSRRIRKSRSGSGLNLFNVKICMIFVNFYLKLVQFVIDFIHFSLENLKNA